MICEAKDVSQIVSLTEKDAGIIGEIASCMLRPRIKEVVVLSDEAVLSEVSHSSTLREAEGICIEEGRCIYLIIGADRLWNMSGYIYVRQ